MSSSTGTDGVRRTGSAFPIHPLSIFAIVFGALSALTMLRQFIVPGMFAGGLAAFAGLYGLWLVKPRFRLLNQILLVAGILLGIFFFTLPLLTLGAGRLDE